jgi:TRAP-type C4-dicarboxylate transport system substrate-binding protein
LAGCAGAPAPDQKPTAPSTTTPVSTPPAKIFKWKLQHAYPLSGYFCKESVFAVKDWMEKRTNGRISIEVLGPDAVAPVMQMLDAVSAGTLDVGWSYPPFYTGALGPLADILGGLPTIWEKADESHDAYYNRGLLDLVRPEYAKRKIFWTPQYMGDIYPIAVSVNKPIRSIADLNGLKVRATGNIAKLAAALGMKPVTMANAEMYSAAKLGSIDGFITSGSALTSLSLLEITKTLLFPNLTNSVGGFMINMDRWNELPQDIQQTFLDFCKYYSLVGAANNYANSLETMAVNVKKFNIEKRDFSTEEWSSIRKIMRNVIEEYRAQGGVVAAAIDIIVKQQLALGNW